MAELRPVPGPRSPFEGVGGRIVAVVVVGILIAMVKPWGSESPAGEGVPSQPPTATPTPRSTSDGATFYDYRAFGPIEPRARWEIWPAGKLISFAFTMRVADEPGPSSAPAATPSSAGAGPSGSPSASPPPLVWPGTDSVTNAWPREVRVPGASILYVLGLSHPESATVDVTGLTRLRPDGSTEAVRFVLGRSPWPDHFLIVGVGADGGRAGMQPWPPGHYRLDVRIGPDGLKRSVDVLIDEIVVDRPSSSTQPP